MAKHNPGGRPRSADLNKLAKLRDQGYSNAQMAKRLGCSERTIARAFGKLAERLPQAVVKEQIQVARVVDHNLAVLDKLAFIETELQELLQECKDNGDTPNRIKVMARFQKGVDQIMEVMSMLHDFRAVQLFQEEVLKIIQEVSPDVREELERRLESRRALFLSVERPTG